jgi:hypothetical protein
MDRQFKRAKKGAVSLTSLLDLLFVMIFVSLLQQKEISPTPTETKPVAKTPVEAKPKPVEKILSSINSTFEFYSLGGSSFKGSFLMEGLYNKDTGNLNLAPARWINKPAGNVGMVPLSGKVSADKMTFTGRVEFQGCKTFDLKRIKINQGSPIAGVWKGKYTCQQGSTGLNLTIQ